MKIFQFFLLIVIFSLFFGAAYVFYVFLVPKYGLPDIIGLFIVFASGYYFELFVEKVDAKLDTEDNSK